MIGEQIPFPTRLKKSDIDVAQVSEFLTAKYGIRVLGKDDTYKKDQWVATRSGATLTIEHKTDDACQYTGNVAIEYWSWGKPSGIVTTKAECYIYKIHEPGGVIGVYSIEVSVLRQHIKDKLYHRTDVPGGDKDPRTGRHTSKLHLFKLEFVKKHWKFLGNLPE